MAFLIFFIVVSVFLGIYIIPKWLIKVPRHIPILFGWFLELPKFSPNLASYTSLSPKCFKKYKKNYGIILEKYYLCQSGTHRIPKISQFWTQKHLFFLNLFWPHPQKRLVSPSVFKEFSVVESWYFRTIIFLKILKHK